MFERKGGKKRTTWLHDSRVKAVSSSFKIGFYSVILRRASIRRNSLCLSLRLLELLMTSFAPLQSSPKELKEVCDPTLRSMFDHCLESCLVCWQINAF